MVSGETKIILTQHGFLVNNKFWIVDIKILKCYN